jgi:type IV secretory pathway VirB4 component
MDKILEQCKKEAAEMLANQKRDRDSYCEKLTDLADSIIETRIRVNEIMAGELMDYYALDNTLESPS